MGSAGEGMARRATLVYTRDPVGMMSEGGGSEITWDGSPGESGAVDLNWG